MATDSVNALVIFGATGDLAKLETFPALVGLVARGVLDVPIVGVAKSGWGLAQFRDYAAASLKLNNMDATTPAAVKLLAGRASLAHELVEPEPGLVLPVVIGSRLLRRLDDPPAHHEICLVQGARGVAEIGVNNRCLVQTQQRAGIRA